MYVDKEHEDFFEMLKEWSDLQERIKEMGLMCDIERSNELEPILRAKLKDMEKLLETK